MARDQAVSSPAVRAYAVSLALLGVTLSPLVRAPDDDAFPLSTYPMFATPRETVTTLSYAVAVGEGDIRHAIPPALVGTGEPLQAMAIFELAAQHPAAARALCEQIAARVARDPALADATSVRIVTGTHDAVEYLLRQARSQEVERARCRVAR